MKAGPRRQKVFRRERSPSFLFSLATRGFHFWR